MLGLQLGGMADRSSPVSSVVSQATMGLSTTCVVKRSRDRSRWRFREFGLLLIHIVSEICCFFNFNLAHGDVEFCYACVAVIVHIVVTAFNQVRHAYRPERTELSDRFHAILKECLLNHDSLRPIVHVLSSR